MDKRLPSRPNLDHLRAQAKELLAALRAGDQRAAREFQEHLPAAQGLTLDAVRSASFKLSDAQSVIARKYEHDSWPKLTRHVEQLMALEGTWSFETLEVDGTRMPPSVLVASRIVMDGDRFQTISPEATYEGVFTIDVECDPPTIDIEFVAGPEKGNWSYGIFKAEGERLTICLGLTGAPRPTKFATKAGSGHALETLVRASSAHRIESRTEGEAGAVEHGDEKDFQVLTPTLEAMQGAWQAVKVVRDGMELPSKMLAYGRRSMSGTRTTVKFGPQTVLDAWTRVDEASEPLAVDYLHVEGPTRGAVQRGILRRVGDEIEVCYSDLGKPRPAEFTAASGSGCTWSRWKRSK